MTVILNASWLSPTANTKRTPFPTLLPVNPFYFLHSNEKRFLHYGSVSKDIFYTTVRETKIFYLAVRYRKMQDLKSYPPVEGNEKRVDYTLYGNAYIFYTLSLIVSYILYRERKCFLHAYALTALTFTIV